MYSIMNAEAREASAQQMAQDADELGEYMPKYVHIRTIRTNTYKNTYEYVRIRTCPEKYGCVRIVRICVRIFVRICVRIVRIVRIAYVLLIHFPFVLTIRTNTYDTYKYVQKYVRNTYEYVRIRTQYVRFALHDFGKAHLYFLGYIRIRTYCVCISCHDTYVFECTKLINTYDQYVFACITKGCFHTSVQYVQVQYVQIRT